MCYDFDAYLAKARIAEQLRAKKPVADESEKQRGVAAPTPPREPETHDRDREAAPV